MFRFVGQNKLQLRFTLLVGIVFALSSCASREVANESGEAENSSDSQSTAVIDVVKVKSKLLKRDLQIPGELLAFQNVAIQAKVQGFVSSIVVDRGSHLKSGQCMMTISCPELEEQSKEREARYSGAISSLRKSEANLDSVKSRLEEAKARLEADSLTLSRLLQTNAKMAGAVAQNDIDVQNSTVTLDRARVSSVESEVKSAASVIEAEISNVQAAKKVLASTKEMQEYLTIEAPFDGVITERNVHVGSMVGPSDSHDKPMLRIQQRKMLRLVVPVPEDSISGMKVGKTISFTVPAYPGHNFVGVIARPGFAIDSSTRTMPVEISVKNEERLLEPGMFANVKWPVTRSAKTLFVPLSALGTDLKGPYVNLVRNGHLERIFVQKGQTMDDTVEVIGEISADDVIALNATDEFKPGAKVVAHLVTSPAEKTGVTQ